MPISRTELKERLSSRDPRMLSAVLEAAEVAHPADANAERLAADLVAALWWRTHTPAGHVALPASLDGLVDKAAGKLGIQLYSEDPWVRLQSLSAQLTEQPISVDELSPEQKKKLRKRLWAQTMGVGAAGTAAGTRWASLKFLAWTTGPLWQLLTMLPTVGPALVSARVGAHTIAGISGPVGIALALMSLNSAFGARWDHALPLLVGAGLVLREPLSVVEPV